LGWRVLVLLVRVLVGVVRGVTASFGKWQPLVGKWILPHVEDGLEAEDTSIAEVPVIGPAARTAGTGWSFGMFGPFQTFSAMGFEGPL